jgi:SCF-associated factor 1
MDCGRSHIVALDQDGTIYELHAWSRALQVVDRDNQWRPGKQVRTIMAGWSFSAVAMKDGRCFVWWAPDEAGFSDDDERDEAPATGILRDVEVDSLLLPGLPDSDEGEEVIVQLACGDNFVVARSASSRVYDLDLSIPLGWQGGWPERRERLRHALHSVERTWRFLPRFSEPANGARISHVQAHYTHFAALSPASPRDTSVVLLGHRGDPEPRVLPTLQGAGIVQLSMGDYHFGAIDDRGVLRTWGAATTGRLGLGDEGRRTGTVEEPTVVDLHGGFAFHLAFAGWHSAALVLRDPSKPEPAKEVRTRAI